jgi:MFS family permease
LGPRHDVNVPGEKLSRSGYVRISISPETPLTIDIDLSARIFLGLAEGGLFPGVTFYLSLWYKRGEQARRVAIFFSAATVAGAFGGILAFAIEKLEGKGGLHGWAWIVSMDILPHRKRTNATISSSLRVSSPLSWLLSDTGICMTYVPLKPYALGDCLVRI